MKKTAALFLFICMITAALTGAPAAAQDVIKAVVTEFDVEIRSAPGSKEGKVFLLANVDDSFLVDPVPIQGNDGGSMWYKILFTINTGHGRIIQTHKLPFFDYSYPYVNAKHIRTEPLDEDEESALSYLKRGRPVNIHVGDDLSAHYLPTEPHTFEAEVTLRKEPKADADTIAFPAGTDVFVCIGDWGLHCDMDEIGWVYLMDRGQKVIGWETWDNLAPMFNW